MTDGRRGTWTVGSVAPCSIRAARADSRADDLAATRIRLFAFRTASERMGERRFSFA
jgi:hypothetical protein